MVCGLDHSGSQPFIYSCVMLSPPPPPQAELGREIHGISSSSKPLAGFTARDGIQESREACGGHGYLAGI